MLIKTAVPRISRGSTRNCIRFAIYRANLKIVPSRPEHSRCFIHLPTRGRMVIDQKFQSFGDFFLIYQSCPSGEIFYSMQTQLYLRINNQQKVHQVGARYGRTHVAYRNNETPAKIFPKHFSQTRFRQIKSKNQIVVVFGWYHHRNCHQCGRYSYPDHKNRCVVGPFFDFFLDDFGGFLKTILIDAFLG